jgi:integrase
MSTCNLEQSFLFDEYRELAAEIQDELNEAERIREEDLRLQAIEEDLMLGDRAANTIKAYRCSWGQFERWCNERRNQSLPAAPQTLRKFISHCLDPKLKRKQKLRTVRGHVAAIVAKHTDHRLPSPLNEATKELLRSSARRLKQQPVKKDALQPDQLSQIAAYLRQRRGRFGTGMRAVRDRAIILIGFNSGWRRSELASLTTDDIAFCPEGVALRLSAGSKTDQKAEHQRFIGVEKLLDSDVCPVQALEDWMKIRGNWDGPLFNPIGSDRKVQLRAISGDSVCKILKRALNGIGVDPKTYGGHSLRAGMITAAARNGATLPAIQDRSGHASLQVLMGYVRKENLFASNPLRGVFSRSA